MSRWWWDQADIDLEGANKRAEETATVLELELESDTESNADWGGEESRGASGSSGAGWSGAEWGRRVTPLEEQQEGTRKGK